MEKHYELDPKDIRIGMEVEVYHEGKWSKQLIRHYWDLQEVIFCIEHAATTIRVKYLDQGDIESLDFKHIGSFWFEKNDYRIRKWKDQEIIIHRWYSNEDNEVLFKGNINNISELKQVLKMLNI